MRIGTPACTSACPSSPPRPKMNGSPPFSRSTRLPASASSISRSEMSRCFGEGLPPRLPAYSTCASARAQPRMRSSTSAS
jgi:hypothetical protein